MDITDCTPYLLQLGLTKSRMSLVWIAGPLSGLIMQPIVGVITDRSRSKWGRRRPFMIGGSIVVAICLLVLGWTSEIVGMYVQDVETVGGEIQYLYLYSTRELSNDDP
jgi:solute carrier family 45 protein 1/2/4